MVLCSTALVYRRRVNEETESVKALPRENGEGCAETIVLVYSKRDSVWIAEEKKVRQPKRSSCALMAGWAE